MKQRIVIEIPEEIYQEAIWSGYSHLYDDEVANAVADGKPLDSVLDEIKAEIEKEIITRNSDQYDYEAKWQNSGLRMALKAIEKYKAESEEQK